MELINAEYTWNTRSTGFFRDPQRHAEATNLRRQYIQPGEPRELFGAGGIYETACNLLYGPKAGPIMADYYKESAWLPETPASATEQAGSSQLYLPMTWDRAFAAPSHWRHLALDAKTWGAQITNEAYLREMGRLNINREELHRRLARRWSLLAALNAKGADYIREALAAGASPQSVDDLRFLETSFLVYQPFTEALAEYHHGLQASFSKLADSAGAARNFETALKKAAAAEKLARESFPNPLDPVGGEVGSARRYSAGLVKAITARANAQ